PTQRVAHTTASYRYKCELGTEFRLSIKSICMSYNITKKVHGALVLILLNTLAFTQPPKQPNLVFVFADQLRADVLGYKGDQHAITPNIDGFAEQAIDFTNAVSVS